MYKDYKVVVNTAAGRRRYMQYLVPFVMASDIVDRYDIWINTHNGADIEFFKRLADAFPKINLVWQPDGWVKGNASINAFYRKCVEKDCVYFKLDDDIVWMELDAIEKMAKFRIDNPDYFLVSPLVINNAQSTYLLQIANKIKLNKYYNSSANNDILWRSGDFAAQLHLWFLDKMKDQSYKDLYVGACPTALCRFSINAILWFGSELAKNDGVVQGDDEETMSCILPAKKKMANCWNGDAIMAHFAFFTQREQLDACQILDKYGEINSSVFHSDEKLSGIYDTVQEILKDIDQNEESLLLRKSPYADYDITKDSLLKNTFRTVIPKSILEGLKGMRDIGKDNIYILG